MKYINELSKEKVKGLNLDLQRLMFSLQNSLCQIADKYKVNRNEVADLFLYLEKKYIDKTDLHKKEVITVEQGMKMLKDLLDMMKNKKDGE